MLLRFVYGSLMVKIMDLLRPLENILLFADFLIVIFLLQRIRSSLKMSVAGVLKNSILLGQVVPSTLKNAVKVQVCVCT